jgi:hypothetical protein
MRPQLRPGAASGLSGISGPGVGNGRLRTLLGWLLHGERHWHDLGGASPPRLPCATPIHAGQQDRRAVGSDATSRTALAASGIGGQPSAVAVVLASECVQKEGELIGQQRVLLFSCGAARVAGVFLDP